MMGGNLRERRILLRKDQLRILKRLIMRAWAMGTMTCLNMGPLRTT